MRNILLILILTTLFTNCKKEKIDFKYVSKKFKEYSDKIEKVEYNIQRIDTFPNGGQVWNNKGFAFIERDRSDELFGYSFYGKRNDIPKEYIYDKGFAFIVDNENKTFEAENGDFGFIGRPGGQMISRHIFYLDSVYKSAELIKDENYYLLRFEFEDDTVYNVTDRFEIIKLKKDNFFPVEDIQVSKILGNKSVTQIILSDIKINDQVKTSIGDFKIKLKEFEIIQPDNIPGNKILLTKFLPVNLPDLKDENNTIFLKPDKPTLLDFWEVWCGHCIASFPDVEKLKNKYVDKLQVIGIVSQDKENAIKLIEKKGITFTNLFGNSEMLKIYGVNSFPRYFLIDKNGIVQKEYFGFTDEIEKDIRNMIIK